MLLILPAVSFSEVICKIIEKDNEIVFYKNGKEIAKRIYDKKRKLIKQTGKIPDGIVKTYNESGKLIGEGNYKDGKLEGISKAYYESGKLSAEWNCKNDKREGITKGYDESGKLIEERNYKDGKLEGISKEYDESGKLKEEWNYKNGKLEGISKEYDESGKLKEEWNYKNGKFEGITKEYDENGKLIGEWNYKDGKLEGISKTYYENGKLKEEWNYKDGKLEGITKEYDESGKLKEERNYKDDKLEGITKEYDENGKLIGEWNYKDGKLEGISKKYYESGKLRAEWNYKDDKLEGISKVYYESGEIAIIDTYKKGNKINSRKYDEMGKLIIDQDYPEEEVFTDEGIIQGLSDTLRTSFFKTGKFTVLERTKMDEILKEQKFQLTGCTTNECAVEIGKILNVNYIVIGSVSKIGKEYVLNIRIVNVESSEVVIADMERSSSEKELIDAIDKLVVSIGNKMIFKDDNIKLKSIAVLDVDVK